MPPADLSRARWGLLLLAAWYAGMLALSLSLDAQVPGGPPPWVSALVLGALSASNAASAAAIGPRRPGAWAWAVMSAGFSVAGCVPAPVALGVVVLLFRPALKTWCLGAPQPPAR